MKPKANDDMEEKEFYTFEEVKDMTIGEVGTPERDSYEAELKAYLIGEAIKRARVQRKLTQAELGDMVGVKKAQISKLEKGRNVTFSTIVRVFKAMGVAVNLDMGGLGRVALC